MGREVEWRSKFRMQAVKRVVAKLQGDENASFCGIMSGRTKLEGDKGAKKAHKEYPHKELKGSPA